MKTHSQAHSYNIRLQRYRYVQRAERNDDLLKFKLA